MMYFITGCFLKASIDPLDSNSLPLNSKASTVIQPNSTLLYLNETDSDILYEQSLKFDLSQASSKSINIQLSITSLYAQEGIDFVIPNKQIVLPVGISSFFVPIKIIGDVIGEGDENFKITISSDDPDISFSNNEVQVEIIENDPIVLSVAALYPNFGNNFFDMIQNQPTIKLPQVSDVSCSIVGQQRYDTCLDGGYYKKVIATGQHNCLNITLEDSLAVFDWKCDSSADPVFFYSTGLKTGKGLKDLLNSASFKNNSVVLKKNSVIVASSTSAVWWSNSVTAISLNNGGSDPRLVLNSTGSFYTLASSGSSRGISITAPKIGFVVLPGATLTSMNPTAGDCDSTFAGTQECLFSFEPNSDYSYLEGNFQGTSNLYSVVSINSMSGIYLLRIHNSKLVGSNSGRGIDTTNATFSGFSLTSSEFSNFAAALSFLGVGSYKILKDLVIYNNQWSMYESATSWYSKYINLRFVNNSDNGLSANPWYSVAQNIQVSNTTNNQGIYLGGYGTIIKNALSVGNNEGLYLTSVNGSVLSNYTGMNNSTSGITYSGSSSGMKINSNLLLVNNATGIILNGTSNPFANLFLTENTKGFDFKSSSTGAVFSQKLILGNTTNCTYTSIGANPGLTGADCDNQGTSSAVRTLSASSINYFKGKVTSETINPHTTGLSIVSSITDWLNFSNPFRLWAYEAAGDISSATRNACSGGSNCRIWDLRLQNTASLVYNSNGVFVNQGNCPSSVQGDVIDKYSTVPHLRYATEIFGDRIGNDNGLCESGEECIFSPNIGYYQGEGDYNQNTCVFENGVTADAVTNVKMYAYPQ